MSTATLPLPVIASRISPPRTVPGVAPRASRRILVVDDNRTIHADFRRIFASASPEQRALEVAEARLFGEMIPAEALPQFQLEYAVQGEQAGLLAEQALKEGQPFAVAFVDMHMPPGWNGIETARRLWKLQPDLHIVICTAQADPSFEEMTRQLRFADRLLILKKPFDPVEVRQLAQALTEKWHQMQEAKARTEDLERMVSARTEELKAANARLQEQARLIDLAHDAITMHDLSDRVQFWSKGAERIYGWRSDEVQGRSVRDLMVRDAQSFLRAKAEVLDRGEWSGELTHYSRTGAELVIDSRWTLVRGDDSEPVAILVVNRDITDRKQLEHQFLRAQRLESLGTLASGVAHDLNNILSPIMMSAPLLREPLPPDAIEEIISTIENAAERGAAIVNQVLTFGRGMEGERVLLQPKHLVREIVKIARETFPKSIGIEDESPKDLWLVNGDATQLHQVLLNLCVNARDAMLTGGKLTISVRNVELDEQFATMMPGARSGPHVLMEVKDSGCGIAPSHLAKIFDPFFTTKDMGKGTGLGLSTVLGIVKSHGGVINARSEVGRGTTFEVYLPASRDASEPAAALAKLAPSATGNGERILVVDDEAGIRTVTEAMLRKSGYQVLQAEEGTEALALYAQNLGDIAVVLTDLMMPNVDGLMLIRALRRMNPNVRVIASSGQGQDARMAELRALNPDAFLTKPFSKEKLLGTLQQVLQTN